MVIPLNGDIHRGPYPGFVKGPYLFREEVLVCQMGVYQFRELLRGIVEPAVVAAGEDGDGADAGLFNGLGEGSRVKRRRDTGDMFAGMEVQVDLPGG
jgi:hypothetical protein